MLKNPHEYYERLKKPKNTNTYGLNRQRFKYLFHSYPNARLTKPNKPMITQIEPPREAWSFDFITTVPAFYLKVSSIFMYRHPTRQELIKMPKDFLFILSFKEKEMTSKLAGSYKMTFMLHKINEDEGIRDLYLHSQLNVSLEYFDEFLSVGLPKQCINAFSLKSVSALDTEYKAFRDKYQIIKTINDFK